MPKLAIYVPKKRMKEIDRWRKKINFSKVFMAALEREIHDRTRATEAPRDKLATAAAHYRSQMTTSDESLVNFGYRLGCDQVLGCRLTVDVIQSLVAIRDPTDLLKKDCELCKESLRDADSKISAFCEKNHYDDGTHPTWQRSLYRGYLQGVTETWNQICQKIEVD